MRYEKPRKEVPDIRRWTTAEHESVLFQSCSSCLGRVFWGNEPQSKYTGLRGSCFMCGREWYTSDLLSAMEDEARRRGELAEEETIRKANERVCSSCFTPFVWIREPGKAGRPRTRCERCYARRVLGAAA